MNGPTIPRRRITIRGQQVTEQDWRGVLAILTSLGYFALIAISSFRYGFSETLTMAGLLSTPEMLVLSWYFRAKENGK